MQYTIMVNQLKALEWGLNSQQAMLFSFLYEVPSWCNTHLVDGSVYYTISKLKVIEELPLLTDKPDTVYRLMSQLRVKGLIRMSSTDSITLIAITDKGKEWNRVGKKSEEGRKKIRGGSEKNPTNHITSNQITNNQVTPSSSNDDADAIESAFEVFWCAGMRKVGKAKARGIFKRKLKESKTTPAKFAHMLINDVQQRIRLQQMGFDKLHPERYLSNERWEDEYSDDRQPAKPGRDGIDWDGDFLNDPDRLEF